MSQILLFTCSPVTYTLWQLARITQAFQVLDHGKSKCSLYGSCECVLSQWDFMCCREAFAWL